PSNECESGHSPSTPRTRPHQIDIRQGFATGSEPVHGNEGSMGSRKVPHRPAQREERPDKKHRRCLLKPFSSACRGVSRCGKLRMQLPPLEANDPTNDQVNDTTACK